MRQCYALGILTGLDGGYFRGEGSMTRAQACAVIMRMIKHINGDFSEQPAEPTPEAVPGQTLANGKPVATENVLAIMEELKEAYPAKSPYTKHYCPNGDITPGDVRDLIQQWRADDGKGVSLVAGCSLILKSATCAQATS